MTHTRDWNASSYARTAAAVEAFGHKLLDRLELAGDETVLDAGCGTGGVTEQLLARVPEGRVIGVDGSPSMIERARERLGERAELRVADLLDLELEEPVDAVFSSATFHWIADHDRLFERLFAALKPGEYFATIMLGSHLERLPGDLRGRFVDRVLAELGDPVTVEYVRLTMSARTPPES